jgi:hypothetical protein
MRRLAQALFRRLLVGEGRRPRGANHSSPTSIGHHHGRRDGARMVSKSPKPVPSGVTDAATVARWKGSGLLYDQRLQQVALDLLDGEVGS